MSTPAIQHLTDRHGVPVVDQNSIDAFISTAQGEAEHVLVFFSGQDKDRPESSDVAVVMPQLLSAYKGRLRGAMVDPAAEAALKGRFTILMLPSLVLARGDQVLDVFPKIIDWSEYVERIDAHLGAPAPGMPLASAQAVVHQ